MRSEPSRVQNGRMKQSGYGNKIEENRLGPSK